MKNIEGEVKHANFILPMELYIRFKLMATTKRMSVVDLYRRACTEFLEKHESEFQKAL